jgi:hypothetical protein
MFGETHYREAYERGQAWAKEVFDVWVMTGRPVPPELPLTKHEAQAAIDLAPSTDAERHARAESVLYAAARVRWRRLVARELGRRSYH